MVRYTKINYEKKDETAKITWKNAEDYYCTARDLLVQFRSALNDAEHDDSVRVVVIDSEGGMFGGGTAIMEGMSEPDGEQAFHVRETTQAANDVVRMIETMEKPVICAIKKMAMGGGLEMTYACDFVIAAENAQLSQPEVEQDVFPDLGGCQRLPRITNWRKAKKVLMLGLPVSGKEAEEIGMVTEAVPEDKVDERVQWYVDKIKSLPAYGMAACKTAMRAAWEMNLTAGIMHNIDLGAIMVSQGHFQEIVSDIIAGRKSEFKPMVRITNGEKWR